jgi:sugar phosphate isomerase/epimerase
MVIAISVGSCYDLRLSYSEAIKFIQRQGVDGIELVFATPKDLLNFELEKEDLEYINSLKFKSIHMPFHEVEYVNDLGTTKLIKKGSKIAEQINADYLVFHPSKITDYSVLDWNLKNCVENLNSKEHNKGFQNVEDMVKLIGKYPKLGLVLDTCHMLETGLNPVDFLELKEYVKGIHLAVQWKQGERIRTHGFLQENKKQLEQIKPLLKLDVPKIIESDFYPDKVSMIKKEIELIRSFENK